MEKKWIFAVGFSQGSVVHSFLKKIFIYLAIIPILFSACVGKMSLEEAKKVTVSMAEEKFVPPPRRIDDILATLDQSGQGDPAISQKFRAVIDKPPPKTGNAATLAVYYHHRGNAAIQMGRHSQALADLRQALDYSSQSGSYDHKLLRNLATAEFVSGNFKHAIDLYEQALRLKEWPSTYRRLIKLYARVGDLESAQRVVKQGISLCNRLRNKELNNLCFSGSFSGFLFYLCFWVNRCSLTTESAYYSARFERF